MVVNKESNDLVRYSSFVGLAFVIIWLGFAGYCYETAPRIPIEESNRVYPINYHGTSIYLNKFEYVTLFAIPGAFLLLGIVSAIFMNNKKSKTL